MPAPPAGAPAGLTVNSEIVEGTIDENGAISAEGRGTVAGVPIIKVTFEGTYDDQAGTLTGEYSMDTEHIISPGHPIVYTVEATASAAAALEADPTRVH